MVTKLLYSKTNQMQVDMNLFPSRQFVANNGRLPQILGLSATIPNTETLQRWLKASVYRTDYRPVPLTEYVKVGDNIFDSPAFSFCRSIKPFSPGDPDHVCLHRIQGDIISSNLSLSLSLSLSLYGGCGGRTLGTGILCE